MTKDEALALALEGLNNITNVFLDTEGNFGWRENDAIDKAYQAITAIKQAQQAHQALIGCVEHLEFSTPQGRAAYEAAKAAINQEPIADSEFSGMWSNSDFTGGATDCDPPAPKQAEPAGYKLVPVYATRNQIVTGWHAIAGKLDNATLAHLYGAMLAAAPTPPEMK